MKTTHKNPITVRQRGAAIVEFLIVAPLLLLLGLGLVQMGMVFHAKSALNFALQEGARVGSVSYGDVAKIEDGLHAGLVPFMGGGTSIEEIAATRARVFEEFQLGAASGWIRVRQLSPTPQSFSDWAEDSFDESGNRIREIPNANLPVLRCTRAPNSGTAGTRQSTACTGGGEPIGADSQQTLSDANLLKLQMTYGVKLSVPLVNRIVGGVLSMAAGCRANEEQRLGPLNLGDTAVTPQPASCAYYNAVNAQGQPEPRIPVSLAVTVRMQSPARFAGNAGWFARANRGRDAHTTGAQLGNGEMLAAMQFAPVPVAQLNPQGLTYANDTASRLSGNGALSFGSDTDWSAQQVTSPGNGMGPGNGGGILPPPECTEEEAPPREDEQSTGILGELWHAIAGIAETAYDFVRGFWEGFKQQIGDLINAVMNPRETAEGIYQLARAFIDDRAGTIAMIAEALGRDLSTLASCGAFDRGRILGNYISPAFMLKVAAKLARFGRSGLSRALNETKRELGCASFGAGTEVLLDPSTLAAIESLRLGDRVSSRSATSYLDGAQDITHTFNRTAQFYYRLKTVGEEFSVTDEHPFWVQGRGWTKVSEIAPGDALATANGDTVVLTNARVDEPLQVFNFSVAATESYFVGTDRVWVHNASCIIRRPYTAPTSPSGHAVGASDGGPGAWREIGRPENARYAYQQAITGTPRRPPARTATQLPEYQVNGVDFDGYDAQRGVLLDAKHLTDGCPLGPMTSCPPDVVDSIRNRWQREATNQLNASRASNTQIEWIVSNEEMSVYVSNLINSLPAADKHRITVIVVLAEKHRALRNMIEDTLHIYADTAYRAPDTLKSFQARVGTALRALAKVHARFADLVLFGDGTGSVVARDHSGLDDLIAAAAYQPDYAHQFTGTAADGSLLPDSRDVIGFTVTFGGRTREPVEPGRRVWFSLRFHGNNMTNHGETRTAFEFPLSPGCEWEDPALVRAIVKVLAEQWQASYVSAARLEFQRRLRRELGNRAVADWMTYFSQKELISCLPPDVPREPFGAGELLVTTPHLPDPVSEKDLNAARRKREALAEFGLADEPFYVLNGWPPDREEEEYECAISGAPHGRKYIVNCVAFDGYDPDRKVLLYAKYFRTLRMQPKEWGLRGWDEPVLNEARRQVRAATKAGGVPIEWHIGLEEPAQRAAELLEEHGGITPQQIQVCYTPVDVIIPAGDAEGTR